ncbi:hypothetical protein [Microbacterium sp. C7(2022)]|uniref:hypothetical protein n=1 Tax=Microbacterium sp. C7(2022) TaxID=2992759 RepID=UPI00237BCA1C|nr:hypothetical protein [Microbacterium sp. C7(2022)]
MAFGVAGCAAPAPDTDPAVLPEGVRVELIQLRADVAPRQAQLRIINDSDRSLTVGAVQVEDPRFDGAATRVDAERTSRVAAGATVDVRVQLPPMACAVPAREPGAGTAAGDGTLVVQMEVPSPSDSAGAPVVAEPVMASDPLGFVEPLYERECRAEALAEAARVEFTEFTPSQAGEPAALTLAITPMDGGATIVGVQRTNLIDFGAATVDGAYPVDLTIDASDEVTVIDLPIVPFRCDPHAVQEDKRGTIFDVRVIVDGETGETGETGESGEIALFVGEDMRGEILTWVAQWCGFAD